MKSSFALVVVPTTGTWPSPPSSRATPRRSTTAPMTTPRTTPFRRPTGATMDEDARAEMAAQRFALRTFVATDMAREVNLRPME